MEILVIRQFKGENSTISALYIDGKFQCWILEDTDRGLSQSMSAKEIAHIKIHGKTAIPTGIYRLTVSLSPRFKKMLPRLLEVPGFAGILIHSGNTHLHTEGCLITGKAYDKAGEDYVIRGGTSVPAYNELYLKIQTALKASKQVFISITTDYNETTN